MTLRQWPPVSFDRITEPVAGRSSVKNSLPLYDPSVPNQSAGLSSLFQNLSKQGNHLTRTRYGSAINASLASLPFRGLYSLPPDTDTEQNKACRQPDSNPIALYLVDDRVVSILVSPSACRYRTAWLEIQLSNRLGWPAWLYFTTAPAYRRTRPWSK